MPWTKADVDKHKKGLTDEQKSRWVAAANNALSQCLKNGGTDKTCAPRAIRIANSLFSKESNFSNMKRLKDYLGRLQEAGRTLSKANEQKVRDAIQALQDVLSQLQSSESSVPEGAKQEAIEQAKDILEAEKTFSELRSILRTALKQKFPNDKYGPFIRDFTSSYVVYERDEDISDATVAGKLFKINYTVDDNNNVTFGEPVQVFEKVTYEPVNVSNESGKSEKPEGVQELVEQMDMEGVPMKLLEAPGEKGTMPIKIIQPGWGNSGYYPKEVLQRDAQNYKAGTHMYWNHQTPSEEAERPEGDLRDLAGVLVSDGYWDENGVDGPGVYADAKPFAGYKDAIKDLKDNIGISHRAFGKATPGEAEGKKGYIIDSINAAKSVDFVTMPGAGGKVLEMFEAARNGNFKSQNTMQTNEGQNGGGSQNNEQLLESLREQNRKLQEKVLLADASQVLEQELSEAKLPDVTKARLKESLLNNATAKDDGELDTDKFKETIKEAIKKEAEYIAKLTGGGEIRGLGESEGNNEDEEAQQKEVKEALAKEWQRMGYSEEYAKKMAEGR